MLNQVCNVCSTAADELQKQWRRTGTWCRSRGSALNDENCIFDATELFERINVDDIA
jgi:hypothetical protein